MSSPDVTLESTNTTAKHTQIDSVTRMRGMSFLLLKNYWILPYQPPEQRLFPCLAVDLRQRFGQGDFLRTGLHAILCVGAVFDPTVAHNRRDAFLGMHRSGRVHIEQPHLAEDRRAHERTVFVYLRAHLQAIAAAD